MYKQNALKIVVVLMNSGAAFKSIEYIILLRKKNQFSYSATANEFRESVVQFTYTQTPHCTFRERTGDGIIEA